MREGWLARLDKVECPDSTARLLDPELILHRAQGSRIWDAEGGEYLDFCAGFGVMSLGHNHPAVLGALKSFPDQLPIVQGMGDVYPSSYKIQFLEILLSLLPQHLRKATLAVSGSQAIEAAMKTALLYTKASHFIAFDGSYHGVDLGALSLNSRQDFRQPFAHWLHPNHVTFLPFGCDPELLAATIANLNRNQKKVAGLVVEPIQGRSGGIIPPENWLRNLRRVCDESKTLLIFDEILVGIGRTGRLTYSDEVPCDLLCLGKAIGGGLPLSACVGTEVVMRAWPRNQGEAIHTGTFFGHPLSCWIGRITLEQIIAENLIQRSKVVGAGYLHRLVERLGPHPLVKEIRGQGLFLTIEFSNSGMGAEFMHRLRKLGLIALASGEQGQCLSLTPALNIDQSLLDQSLDVFQRALAESKPFIGVMPGQPHS